MNDYELCNKAIKRIIQITIAFFSVVRFGNSNWPNEVYNFVETTMPEGLVFIIKTI
jgi:hypothetical protein